MKTIVIGAVNTTRTLIEEMLSLNIPINMVFSLDDKVSKDVSGYYPLHIFAEREGIPYQKYIRINDEENIKLMEEIEPDYIFAIGFSQLVSERILKIPKIGVIGLHPAPLPKFRGRAVIVWQMLFAVRESMITMFRIDAGADSGDIIDQEPYYIDEEDYAEDVLNKIHIASVRLFQRTLKNLLEGKCEFKKQDHNDATYCLKRTPADGLINWNDSPREIVKLIRAISRPYPGAFSYYDGKHKILIWRAHFKENNKYYGFPGQIAEVIGTSLLIVLNDGLLHVEEYENLDGVKLLPGHKLEGLA